MSAGGEIDLRVPGLSATGLRLSEELPFETWERLGAALGAIRAASVWAIGDWLVYGEAVYGETYAQGAAATGLAPETLMDYASVARRIPFSRRRGELSFSHHRVVRSLEPAAQGRWLDEAIETGWTASELRDRVRAIDLDSGAVAYGQTSDAPRALRSATKAVSSQAKKDGDRYVVPPEPIARLRAALGEGR